MSVRPGDAPGAGAGLPPSSTAQHLPLGLHARRLRNDASSFVNEVRETADDLEHTIASRMTRRPLTTLGAALAAGYVLGGGLRSRLTFVLVGAAARLAGVIAMRELGERISPRTPPTASRWKP